MDHDKKFINIDDVPFLRLLALFYKLFSIFIVIASFGIACILLPQYWKRYRAAKTKSERAYFGIHFSALWCFVYAFSMLALLTVDASYQWGVIDHWPTFSFIFFGWGMAHSDSVCIDVIDITFPSVPKNWIRRYEMANTALIKDQAVSVSLLRGGSVR